MHSIIIASLLAFATGSLANNFIYPAATGGQAFHDGDTIDVAWTTTYTDPVLQLYCNYLTTRKLSSRLRSSTPYVKHTACFNLREHELIFPVSLLTSAR